MIYKKCTQIYICIWIEPWSKFNNLFTFFVTSDILYIWHSLWDYKNLKRVSNEEIVPEMWKKVRNKKLWKEEQMVRVRKSFNQVNTLHQLGKKKNHGLNFQSFWQEMESKNVMSIYIAKKVTQRALQTQNFL